MFNEHGFVIITKLFSFLMCFALMFLLLCFVYDISWTELIRTQTTILFGKQANRKFVWEFDWKCVGALREWESERLRWVTNESFHKSYNDDCIFEMHYGCACLNIRVSYRTHAQAGLITFDTFLIIPRLRSRIFIHLWAKSKLNWIWIGYLIIVGIFSHQKQAFITEKSWFWFFSFNVLR